MKKGLFLFIVLLFTFRLFGQEAQDSTTEKRNTILPLPVVFYLPETRWAVGATVNYNFRLKSESDTSLPSQVLAGFAVTQEKQLLLYAPFTLYWNEAKSYSFGEVGFYKYFYNYYGVGSDSKEENSERFTVDYPRIRANVLFKAPWVKEWSSDHRVYIGGQYWFENYKVKATEEGGELGSGNITGGASGGFVSGYGAITIADFRDAIYYPTKGQYLETSFHYNPRALGSDFEYARFRYDHRFYHQFKWKHVFAANVFLDHTMGDPPFHLMGLLGGTRRLRGWYEGRFRDKTAGVIQGEYRMELPYRFGLVAFAGTGTVASSIEGLFPSKWHPSYGGGLRFKLNKEEHLNLRLDVGFTPEGSGFYFTFGEAF